MALFQPSHIVPSSLSGLGNGVVAASQNVNITWQVNGNSPMTAFQIDILTNDANSSLVYSTGVIDSGYGLPFYGVDSKGNSQTFSYNPEVTWGSLGIVDGNNYKLSIIQYWNGTTDSVLQYSESAFIARTLPVLTINDLAATLATVSGQFSASYTQAQGDGINWARWELSVVQDGSYEVVDDTGEINTALLAYEYDGFMTGNVYAISLTVETRSGIVATTGWQEFSVEYTEKEANGAINLQYDPDNECALLSWQKASNIPATTIQGTSENPLGGIEIAEGGEILWNQVDQEEMAFSAPYSAYWKGAAQPTAKIYDFLSAHVQSGRITCSLFSHDGTKLFLGDEQGSVHVFGISEAGEYTYQSTTRLFASPVSALAINAEDTDLVVCFNRTLSSGSTQSVVRVVDASSFTAKEAWAYATGAVYTAVFCDSRLFIGGSFPDKGILYSSEYEQVAVLNEDGDVLASDYFNGDLYLGGRFTGYAAIYLIVGSEEVTLEKFAAIDMETGTPFDGEVTSIRFDPEHYYACFVGAFSGMARVYSLANSTLTFVSAFPDLQGTVVASAWNNDATKIVLVGDLYSSAAKLYSFENDTITFLLNPNSSVGGESSIQGTCVTANFSPDGKNLVIGGDDRECAWLYAMDFASIPAVSFGDNLSISFSNGFLNVNANGNAITLPIANEARLSSALVGLIPGAVAVYWLDSQDSLISTVTKPVQYTQPNISQVLLSGEQTNFFVYIANTSVTFEGNYDVERGYETLFLTDYSTANYQAGVVDGLSNKNALYRASSDGGALFPVYKFPATINRIKDFSVKSNHRYLWEMFYVSNGDEYSSPITTQTFCKQFKAFTLIEATEDPNYPNVYHVLNVWRFGNNVSNWSVSNNNTPGILHNFTKYPRRQPSTQAYKSGVLQSLLSNVKNGKYSDNAKQMELLFSVSESENTFFLRDVKGNLYMVHTNGPITQSMSTKSYFNEVTISLPWVEVGDASNVSIIQTPEDEGWENNQVALAEMDLNAETSLLSVSYPNPYTGTIFGTNGAQLTATTPSTVEQVSLEIENGDLYATT